MGSHFPDQLRNEGRLSDSSISHKERDPTGTRPGVVKTTMERGDRFRAAVEGSRRLGHF